MVIYLYMQFEQELITLDKKITGFLIKPDPNSRVRNRGKVRRDLVSFTFLFDIANAFSQFVRARKADDHISADLLTRYITEAYSDYMYIFARKKKAPQSLLDAFALYGQYLQSNLINGSNIKTDEKKWLTALGHSKVQNKNSWTNVTKSKVFDNEHMTHIYKHLSLFAHPSIFSLERTVSDESNIYKGFKDLSERYVPELVIEVFVDALERKLYGLKHFDTKREIIKLKKLHEIISSDLRE